MQLCIFNPEHDLCMAKGRAHYVPPMSAVEFSRRDADIMKVLYPEAVCSSVYDLDKLCVPLSAIHSVSAWGWDAVVRHEAAKRGVPESLLPTAGEVASIRELQHRSTILPLQPDCHAVYSADEMETLLLQLEHWVMKAPWSGAGRGLRWVHGALTAIDRDWLAKTVDSQRCIIAEPRRNVVANVALEYMEGRFAGYSYFRTSSGVYKENIAWPDSLIEEAFPMRDVRQRVEPWLEATVWPRYHGPLGVDLMVCADSSVHVAEINLRHTMGMVAHAKIQQI